MNEKQRAEFEKWAVQHEYDLTWSGAINCYAIMRTRIVFDAWQAAIASVVVDIKNLPSASYASSGVVYLSDVADAIEKSGVRHNDE